MPAFALGTLLSGAALASGIALVLAACEPQNVYFYDPETLTVNVSDAGENAAPTAVPARDAGAAEPVLPPPPDDADEPAPPTQPACESAACEQCLDQRTCVGSALPFCHPVGGQCVVACDVSVGDAPGNCPGAARCDLDRALCVECLGRDDCSAATPACDVPSGVCVGCLGGEDCAPAGQVCDTTARQCVDCVVDSDCAASLDVCLESEQRCVECETNADCRRRGELSDDDDEQICSPDLRCVECITNADCAVSEPDKPFCVRSECEDERD